MSSLNNIYIYIYKDSKGRPTRYALTLKKWGFSSAAEARAFANKHKKSKISKTRTA